MPSSPSSERSRRRAPAEMRPQRIEIAELARLGGPVGVAAHLRSLVASGASVQQPVREIVERVRADGDAAVLDYTHRFDARETERSELDERGLRVTREELDAAIKRLPLE